MGEEPPGDVPSAHEDDRMTILDELGLDDGVEPGHCDEHADATTGGCAGRPGGHIRHPHGQAGPRGDRHARRAAP